jgi:hypothetical protein
MCAGLKLAGEWLTKWNTEHQKGFPPVVINITDGECTDGDPVEAAKLLTDMGTDDGKVMLLNVHLSATSNTPVEMPSDGTTLADDYAKQLFLMSSALTPFMVARAKELGVNADENSRGFVFNAHPVQVIQFLDIGTRPSNLR